MPAAGTVVEVMQVQYGDQYYRSESADVVLYAAPQLPYLTSVESVGLPGDQT